MCSRDARRLQASFTTMSAATLYSASSRPFMRVGCNSSMCINSCINTNRRSGSLSVAMNLGL